MQSLRKKTNMQNLLKDLETVLEQDSRFLADGKILKNAVVEAALKLDAGLIKLLLGNAVIRKHFFVDVEGTCVFDKVKFQDFVSNKQFLPDSYTAFRNKIGLFDRNNKPMSDNKDVVLSWAYKDCVLEGGMTKEEAARDEIFYNTTLAPDEITRLFDPKVFTNFEYWDGEAVKANKAKPVTDINQSENLLIKGNNLIALHSLKLRYAGKVKLIYIDPPYNTEEDSFRYNDSFNHSTWLTFMKNRLEVAKDLLAPHGMIFIHIGDREMHYLKLVGDEVFGRDHFIATVPRKTRSGKSDVPYKLSQDFDWILTYTKGAKKTDHLFQREVSRKYYKTPDFPNDEWRLTDLTKQTPASDRKNSDFTLINPKNGDEYPVNPNRSWAITKDTAPNYIAKNKIVFPGDYDFLNISIPAMRVFKSEEIAKKGEDFDKAYVSTDFLNKIMDDLLKKTTNKKGTDELIELFGSKIFGYPKNELLLKNIIEYTTKEGDIVMDFFSGTGTTPSVAHKMGRRWIAVEQMDYIKDLPEARLKKVLEGEQGGISKDVDWQGGGDFIYCEIAKWNERYIQDIRRAKTTKDLLKIRTAMADEAFFRYDVDMKPFDGKDFAALDFADQQKTLLSCLEMNHLYVNYSEIEDKTYAVSDDDKKLNRQFYKGGKD